jgi:hypothetical protein
MRSLIGNQSKGRRQQFEVFEIEDELDRSQPLSTQPGDAKRRSDDWSETPSSIARTEVRT